MKKNTKKIEKNLNRLTMLAWIVMPLLIVWVSINYLIGAINKPNWQSSNQVLGYASDIIENSNETENWAWNGNGLVTLWFDDAWISQYKVGFPILEEKRLKAALAVPTDNIGFEAYMNWTQIKRVQFAGWEVTSHSRTHDCSIPTLSSIEMENEILGAKKILQERGIFGDIYVAPCGTHSDESTQIIKKFYSAARNVNPGLNDIPLNDFYNIQILAVQKNTSLETVRTYLSEAKQNNKWLILMFHEISENASEYGSNEKIFRDVIEEVVRSNLEVVLPSQVINISR